MQPVHTPPLNLANFGVGGGGGGDGDGGGGGSAKLIRFTFTLPFVTAISTSSL